MLANCDAWKRVFANFTSSKSKIALQVARKITPCDRALIDVCLSIPIFTIRTSYQFF